MAKFSRRRPAKSGAVETDARADDAYAAPDTKPGEDDASDDVHALAMKRWQAGYERDRDNIDEGYEDLQFLEGEPVAGRG